ncbi:MAG: Hsp20/alpha crystallin family protein [Clostridium sp.]|nr:Hsp20/alpha crystallin family protein [Clostridium sp.]MCM1172882.1 Hsp20/alpha crystallin family protein [Clostridium sp.]MCM1209209.1 Hsp20/alpha crystallin family protein [Ruminococcus sp.]
MLFKGEMINIFDDSETVMPQLMQLMRTDIQEKDGDYLLEIELPGFLREDIQAELADGKLTIIAERPEHIEMEGSKSRYIRRERPAGGCQRSFFVGDKVKQEDISAAFKDGILSIIITNREKSVEREERKLIPIK